MLKNRQSILGLSFLVLSCVSSINSKAIANEIEPRKSETNRDREEILLKQLQQNLSAPLLGQINSVSQMQDVSPEDWAYIE